VQGEDGTLYVKCPQEIRNAYPVPVALEEGYGISAVEKVTDGWLVGDNARRSLQLLAQMPENCRIELDFTTSDDIGDFGILLRSDERNNKYYSVKFEQKFNRLAFDMQPRRDNCVHTQTDVERYCPLVAGEKNHMTVIVEGSVAEVYVNDRIAMSVRMFDHKEGWFGLYAQNTAVRFENVQMYAGE